jgi:hypothetical protein
MSFLIHVFLKDKQTSVSLLYEVVVQVGVRYPTKLGFYTSTGSEL